MSDPKEPSKANSSAVDKPENPSRRRLLGNMALAGAALTVAGCSAGTRSSAGTGGVAKAASRAGTLASSADARLDAALSEHIRNVVVIFCENRSFNNLFADFPGLEKPLSGLSPDQYLQRDRDGSLLKTLPPIWHGMVPHHQRIDGKTCEIGQDAIKDLPNAPWKLHTPDGEPLPHGIVTSSPIHVFYRNQM